MAGATAPAVYFGARPISSSSAGQCLVQLHWAFLGAWPAARAPQCPSET
jgi:hypothetical protein